MGLAGVVRVSVFFVGKESFNPRQRHSHVGHVPVSPPHQDEPRAVPRVPACTTACCSRQGRQHWQLLWRQHEHGYLQIRFQMQDTFLKHTPTSHSKTLISNIVYASKPRNVLSRASREQSHTGHFEITQAHRPIEPIALTARPSQLGHFPRLSCPTSSSSKAETAARHSDTSLSFPLLRHLFREFVDTGRIAAFSSGQEDLRATQPQLPSILFLVPFQRLSSACDHVGNLLKYWRSN